jgi:hypothetical protein
MAMADIKVYQFGARWHWKCERNISAHEGGMKRTQPEALAAAQAHYDENHRAAEADRAQYIESDGLPCGLPVGSRCNDCKDDLYGCRMAG